MKSNIDETNSKEKGWVGSLLERYNLKLSELGWSPLGNNMIDNNLFAGTSTKKFPVSIHNTLKITNILCLKKKENLHLAKKKN